MSKFDYVPPEGLDILDITDTHDQIVLNFLEYFKQVEIYSRHRSYRPQQKARKALHKMSLLIKERRKELSADYHANKEGKSKSGRKYGT
jgi:hypothetical protein|tara:strand:- start:147 stop:413 length:267 start_codon:yes stop_codon:yes gene_type:complete